MAEHKIIVYSTPTCHFCVLAKAFFEAEQIPFEMKDVAQDKVARDEMVEKSGQMGVPVIDIDGEIIVGFDQEKIKSLLGM
jgi:glutaredoxin 3